MLARLSLGLARLGDPDGYLHQRAIEMFAMDEVEPLGKREAQEGWMHPDSKPIVLSANLATLPRAEVQERIACEIRSMIDTVCERDGVDLCEDSRDEIDAVTSHSIVANVLESGHEPAVLVELDELEDTVSVAVAWVVDWLGDRGLLEVSVDARDELVATSARDVRSALEHGADYLRCTAAGRRGALYPLGAHEQEVGTRRSQIRLVKGERRDEQD